MTFGQTTPDDVVGKVLRRAEVAKVSYPPHFAISVLSCEYLTDPLLFQMARKLQDRLALANYKAQNGQERLSFRDVEAHLESTTKRKRPGSSIETSSNSSSSSADRYRFPASSPLTESIMFSDAARSSGQVHGSRRKDAFPTVLEDDLEPSKRHRSHSMAPPLFEASRTSWKSDYNLSQSSPVYRHHGSQHEAPHQQNQSFASEMSTIPDSPPFSHLSEGERNHHPTHSFNHVDSATFNSSPPRTPPPTRHRTHKSDGGDQGVDLLLFLATSPSPANRGQPSRIFAPSTPPSNTVLPSQMLNTPGALAGFGTPGQQFNFADFVNVTPSPAQGVFGNRTPGLTKTPLAAKDARRRLNFDTLAPPSPNTSNVGRGTMGKESGLGMELGGELVSSQ